MSVVLETTKGDLTVDLYTKERPKTCLNFLKLCKTKSFNLNRFHYVERNFLCQTGDPTGTGRGGESIYGKLYGEQARFYEAEQVPILKHTKPGLLSMVNVGDNMLGSQFFITLGENLDYLDKEHCVFGEVVEGLDTLLSINDAICDEKHIPYQDIRITHAVILDDPFNDPPGLVIPSQSPVHTKEMVETGRIAADEDINEMEGKTAEEVEELLADKEAKARATILEMVGDLPSIDAAPPENVLFVCKLNPVTADDDLMIIFSRFGKIVNCEIIRDRQTGNSLQYAFIEFDNPKSCEDAYFKMDNVLIDDRRIHVDFSQSVSRLQWKGKGRGVEFVGGKFDPNKEDYKMKGQKGGQQFKPREDRPPPRRQEHNQGARDQRERNWQPREADRRRDYHERGSRRSPERYHRREPEGSSRRYDEGERRNSSRRPHRSPDRSLDRHHRHRMDPPPRSGEREKRDDPSTRVSRRDDGDVPSKRSKRASSTASSSSSSSDDRKKKKKSKKSKKSKRSS